ncbi:MAG: PKD domain-containing protein, partial [Bacteroidota bacterium]
MLLLFNSYSQGLPAASFSISDSIGCSPLSIQFTNTSVNAVSYYWDFGNGNTSTLQNPTNLYLTSGIYTVQIIAVSSSGQSDTITAYNLITVVPDPIAGFYSVDTAICLNGTPVSFVNTSLNSDYCVWDFGDGNTSTLQNPNHTYISPGYYNVTLIAGNVFGCSTVKIKPQYIYVYPKIIQDFIVDTTVTCDVNHLFSFSSTTPGASSWLWDFGDGNLSILQNPVHTYSATGIYTLSLAAYNLNGCGDTLVKSNLINVDAINFSGLTSNVTSGCAPLSVHFTGPSFGAVSWSWDFGDGNPPAGGQNPDHTYTMPGNYNVSLSITNSSGCTDDTFFSNYIEVYNIADAGFTLNNSSGCAPLNAQFTDASVNAASWLWDFGDGITSVQQDPSHTYTSPGNFTVTLTAYTSAACSDVVQMVDTIKVLNPSGVFSSDISVGCAPLTVAFSDLTIGADQWFWDFGDGDTSTQQDPVHTYDTIGEYDVTLITGNTYGCFDTVIFPSYIKTVFDTPSYVPPPPITGCAPLEINFSDNTNGAVSWYWDFGDGNSSVLQNPTHNYTLPGSYNVSLVIELSNGCTQVIQDFNILNIQGSSPGFEVTPDQCSPNIVEFTDTSFNAVSWFWDFGDGNTSSQQNPVHLYNNSGSYPVYLTITTPGGCSYTIVQIITVVTSVFDANPYCEMSNTNFPANVDFFANTPDADSWFWDFGGGSNSTLENPSHNYATGGIYYITLIISDGTCTDTLYYQLEIGVLGVPLDMQISGSASTNSDSILTFYLSGCAPLTVYLNNMLPESTSWYWVFGDGNTSTLENPSNMYSSPGIYDVTLIAQGPPGLYDTIILQDYIYVSGTIADFSIVQTTGCDSIMTSFTDNSYNAVQWSWDFGDGAASNQQNPVHNYPVSNNIYPVILITNDTMGCSDMKINSIYSGTTTPS